MLKLPSILKTPKHRTFDFKTRYYNAEKEAFDARVKAAMGSENDADQSAEEVKQRIRQNFRAKHKSKIIQPTGKQNLRVAIIIVILSAVFFWILK